MRCVCLLAGQGKLFGQGRLPPKADMAASLMSTLMPTDLTISAQRAVSLSIRARNCAGEA
jgi:hypothetical protein